VRRVLRFTLIGCGVLLVFVLLGACDQTSSPVESQEKRGGVEQAAEGDGDQPETVTPSGLEQAEPSQQVAGNMPIAGVIGQNVETESFDFRVLDYFITGHYFYLTDPFLSETQDYFSQAGKFVVVNYSVTNTSPETIGPTPIGRLHARAGDKVEVYEQSDQIVPGGRMSPQLQMDEIPPRQMRVSQFIFDVPTDVEPELVAVTNEPAIDTDLDVGVVDLTKNDPQGPRPEEILALQYEYSNMTAWEQAYDLFAQESKDRVPLEEYVSEQNRFAQETPTAIIEYSFPTVDVQGNHATIERVFTASDPEGEYQDKVTQEAVLEENGWRILMRDDQYELFLGGEETTQ
jgi:hypothetical protein